MPRIEYACILTAVSSEEQVGAEKVSLDEQESSCRAWCVSQSNSERTIKVLKVLTIPGHSRYDSDLELMLIDYREKGITVYDELADLWRRKACKYLVIYHDSRASRSKTGFTWVTENWLRAGGEVYSIIGGEINPGNEDFRIAMGAINATNSVKKLMADRRAGVKRRASLGKLVGVREPFTHYKVYNEKHDVIGTKVREDRRYLFDAVYKLVVEDCCSMSQIAFRLAELGYYHPETGKRFHAYIWYQILYSPVTWGHVSQYENNLHTEGYEGEWFGLWGIGPEYGEPPEPVELHYNVIPPVWTGAQAETLKAELRRRKMMVGSRRPGTTHTLSGLLICGGCGYTLSYARNREWRAYRCITSSVPRFQERADCTVHNKSIRDTVAYDALNDYLRDVLACPEDTFFERRSGEHVVIDQLGQSEALLQELNRKIDTLIQKQAAAHASVSANYDVQIAEAATQKEALEKSLVNLRVQSRPITSPARKQAVSDLRQIGLEKFWLMSEPEQHQLLERIFEGYRFLVTEGEITDLVPAPPHFR